MAEGRARVHASFTGRAGLLAEFAAKYDGWDAADPAQDGPRVLIEIVVERWLVGGP